MRARGWVVAALIVLGGGVAGAEGKDPRPRPVDIKPLRADLRVYQDGAGGTYVIYKPDTSDARAWYGTGKILYEQRITGRSRDGSKQTWSLSTWAPRVPNFRPGSIDKQPDGTIQKSCDGKDDAVLGELVGDKAKAVLDKVQLHTRAFVRWPQLIARDDAGIYYYIDRLDKDHGGQGFRVFVGRKGAMKQLPLLDVASDSAGQVFSTKSGDVRLVHTKDEQRSIVWIKGGKRTELVALDNDNDALLIFSHLGVYKFLGTICDNI